MTRPVTQRTLLLDVTEIDVLLEALEPAVTSIEKRVAEYLRARRDGP